MQQLEATRNSTENLHFVRSFFGASTSLTGNIRFGSFASLMYMFVILTYLVIMSKV